MMLRDYQEEARAAIEADLALPRNSLVVMPTASGKSHVIAAAAKLWGDRPVLILQPTIELLIQNKAKLAIFVPEHEIGVYSASAGEKIIRKYTFATIQSVYKKPELFTHIPLVIIDEAHNLAPRSLSTMYKSFLIAIGNPKVLGFTATPYRLEVTYHRETVKFPGMPDEDTLVAATTLKLINRMRHKNETEMFWKRIIYNVSHATLLEKGYLSPLEYIGEPLVDYAEIPINKQHSDYNLEAYSQSIVGREADILNTISEAQRRYKSVLVFCPTTEQARHLSSVVKGSGVVLGDTNKKERAQIVDDFKNFRMKTVFNVGTLTTGFDHPALDCVILLRPTRSLPLYNQMLGRLTRLAEGKTHGTVIDLTGTCKALGRIETFELYQDKKGLWDLRTEKHEGWNNRVLFTRAV